MSPEELRATLDATKCSAVANAVLEALNYNALNSSRGIAIMATVIAGSDPLVRCSLAKLMIELARELDPDLVNARWQ